MRVIAVPVKSLERTKRRLSSILAPEERAQLTLAMLQDVLRAATRVEGWSAWVISPDDPVLEAAEAAGARAVREAAPEPTLLKAVRQAEDLALPAGAEALAVLLADLPLLSLTGLEAGLASRAPVALAPSHSDGGTNLLVRRPPDVIPPRFGRRSFERHRAEAAGRGIAMGVIRRRELAFDLDRPEDVQALLASRSRGRTASVCREMDLAARLRVPAG